LIPAYEATATRLENRGYHPPSREYVDGLVAALFQSGVEACWNSAVDPRGTPFYPSQVFPVHHPQASLDAFRYLISQLHAIGRPVLSWYALNLGGGVLPAHPDWAVRFYRPEGVTSDPAWDDAYACINSPYGDLLPRFVAEVVRDVGFDGVWFDGSTFANHNSSPAFAQPGCRCDHCRERFRRDAGLSLPERLDPTDPAFRSWIRWRYERLMAVWRSCVEAVAQANPKAVVCFNNYRRRPFGAWQTAIPLRTLGWDAVMSCELDGFPGQADIQMKICQAYGLKRGVESWWPLCDHWNVWVPDHEPLTAVQATLGCIAAGGVASTGVGVDPLLMAPLLRAMEDAAAPRMPFASGETVHYAAILASQNTMDFYATPLDAWDGIHGANEFCRHAHLQSAVVFDDTIERGELGDYAVLLLGNAACLSSQQAARLEEYMRGGGVLVACHDVGTRDEAGDTHATPVLDALLGVQSRRPGQGAPTLELTDAALIAAAGRHVTFKGPHTLAEPADDVKLLGNTVGRTSGHWDEYEFGDRARPAPRSPGLWVRPVGQGCAVYAGVNLFETYLRYPTTHMMRMLRALLIGLRMPAVTVEAPLCVTVNTRRQAGGRWAVHLHNAPGSAYAYPNPPRGVYLHAPGEVVPVRDLRIQVHGRQVRRAWLALTGQELAARGNVVEVPRLDLHEVVLLEIC
jgi:hypothetical protein